VEKDVGVNKVVGGKEDGVEKGVRKVWEDKKVVEKEEMGEWVVL
jgi:hypothetical protein